LKIIIPGQPIPKTRPRFSVKKGCKDKIFTKTYDDQEKDKLAVKWTIVSQIQEKYDQYVSVNFKFYFEPPASSTQFERNNKLWFQRPTNCDLDNLEKFYLDCCNGIVFTDDRQIISLSSNKYYSTTARTEITIMPRETNLSEDISKIMGIYGPDELIDFLRYAYELSELYNVTEENDWVKDQVGEDEVREVRITRTAYLLSKLAHNHAVLLKKIDRSCPAFWQKAENLTKVVSDGK
jgi:Holliday junction resolvase RusA-like endonuclease